MKSLFLALGLLVSMNSFATTTGTADKKIVSDKAAYIKVCPRLAVGCKSSIVVKNKSYTLSYDLAANRDNKLSDLVNAIIGNNQFHGITKSEPFTVEGYVAKEKGYFPNPTVEFTVFKITFLDNVRLPR